MRSISTLLLIMILTGCATTQTIESEPGKLKEQLADGNGISWGAIAHIETSDGEHHKFLVKKVTNDFIEGENVKVPIDDVVSISTDYTSSYMGACLGVLYFLLLFIPYTI